MHEIVVLGAGYAGLTAATSLLGRRPGGARITVVEANERFTERLRLHQVVTGQPVEHWSLPELLGPSLVTARVGTIDATARTVRLTDGRRLHYDNLVYGLGSHADTTTVPGADGHAYTLDVPDRLATRLDRLGTGAVAVCGAGLTGLETATEIAERFPRLTVTLIGDHEPGGPLAPGARAHVDRALRRLGVRVVSDATVTRVGPDTVELSERGPIAADLTIWTAGVRAHGLATTAGFATDRHGRLRTDGMLRSVSHPEVFGVGDAAAIEQPFGVLHGTCQSGMPTGVQAALNIHRALSGRPPARFRFGYLHTAVSLGRNDAIVQFTAPDGSPARAYLTGRAAVRYKETVTSSVWPSMARMLRHPGSGRLAWRRGGRHTR